MDPIPEQPRETSFLPVSKEVADAVLAEIKTDPAKTHNEELIKMHLEQPGLSAKFEFLAREYDGFEHGVEKMNYINGLVLGYKILKQSAESKGTAFPKLTDEEIDSTFISWVDEIRKVEETGESMEQYREKKWDELKAKDPIYHQAMQEVGQYRMGRQAFYKGASEVYDCFQRKVEAYNMEQQANH